MCRLVPYLVTPTNGVIMRFVGLSATRSCTKPAQTAQNSRALAPHPLHLYPDIAPKVFSTSNVATKCIPRHGLNSRMISLCLKPRATAQTNCPHHLKVANPSTSVPHTLSGGNGACRRWGDDNAPQRGPGAAAPGTPLVPFVVKRKEPRVRGGAPAQGECRGAAPLASWIAGTPVPAKFPGARG